MKIHHLWLSACASLAVQDVCAQSPNRVPVFTSTSLTDSAISSVGGSVGIGTSTPGAKLDVEGGSIAVGGMTSQSADPAVYTNANDGHWMSLSPSLGVSNWNGIVQAGDQGVIYSGAGQGTGAFVIAPWAAATSGFRMDSSGKVGIGAASPTEKLEVNGNIRLSSGSGHHIVFQDGSVQDHAWDGVLEDADFAESVDVAGPRSSFEPGDLIVLDPDQAGLFQKASKPYSTLISGVYSTKPRALGRHKPRSVPRDAEVPMAMVGIVPTKVSTENGAVHIGDLLVSSSTPGDAMKGTNRKKLTGAVLGKAMDSLESGKGVIQALISLQ